MANKKINYTERDFEGIRQELINYTKQYYPELVQNFNDASIFSVLMDLNAAVADNLNYQIDRSVQETVLQYAQQRSSIYNIARTYGLKIPGYRPSVAVVELYTAPEPATGCERTTVAAGSVTTVTEMYFTESVLLIAPERGIAEVVGDFPSPSVNTAIV